MKKKLIFLHPFLFALYPVIFLYAQNIHEYRENVILAPLVIALVFAAVVFGITRLLVKKIEQAAIISSVFILLSFSYSRLLEAINGFPAWMHTVIPSDVVLYICSVLLLILTVYLISRYTKNLLAVNKLLTFLSTFLIVVSLITIISFELETKRIVTPVKEDVVIKTQKNSTPAQNAPDIYYFIFDRYAGPKSLKEEYAFDNSKFLNLLKQKGFYIAENAKTNYPKTFLSLGSSFNMEYLDALTKQTNGGKSADESLVTPLIRNGKIIQFLKERGYVIVNIGPKTWTPTSMNPNADKNFIMPSGTYMGADIFTTGFLNTTIAGPILQKLLHNPLDVSQDPNNNEHRNVALYEIKAVEQAITIQGPKFVFVHILLPHDPFVFDKNCTPISEITVNQHDHIYNYLNQLQCANLKIEKLMNAIIKMSKTPPVIILQSDEGPFPMKEPVDDKQSWGQASDTALREKFPILNAYYFPNASTSALYDSITPVNSFRVLFNTYFGTDYPLLSDKNYVFTDEENYYKFTDVTERVK
jgi:hypothetical protein